ncbi:hypothetical protein C4K22_1894 [Pseudomonas chlororaphis subsp. aurantiaca]|uniref:hypothetical protein n=1 Tax=Pseudomonas chlororaphis TaxID=587753 RepID=UPI000F563DB6|nr:hypothetical protein [Pseudomonas chlororaphis]AZD34647.1 hypothetical protein C4K22_1894 [Pseudomonas chlororaphis subsp. aurantiaca]AZD40982.1 hypothetical protein C4K21_1898 [Pseudomonas chlororaphis subsp. aurantiaca]
MHSFRPYSLKIFDKYLPGEISEKYHVLDNVRSKDLLDFVEAFLKSLTHNVHDDVETKKTIRVTELHRKERSVYGWMEYGEYGIPGAIYSLANKAKTYDKKHDDSDVRFFYFNFCVPSNSKTAVALLHSAGNRGVKSFFNEKFNAYFKMHVDLNVRMSPLSHEKTVQEWLDNSSVKELRLSNYNVDVAGDIADQLDVDRTEFVIKPKRGSGFGSFSFLQSKAANGGDSPVEILSKISTDVRAVIESNGRKKIVSLKMSDPIAAIEITEDNVDIVDGAPDRTGLHNYADVLMKEFIDKVSR